MTTTTLTAHRTFNVLSADDDGAGDRTVSGLALPYGEDLDRPDWFRDTTTQRFNEDAATVRDNAQLFYGHDHRSDGLPVGRVTDWENTPDGLTITARLSETPKGDEVYTLLKDGVLTQFSIGYYESTNHIEDGDVLVHDAIDVFEISVVPDPAYKSALIESVLSNEGETLMPDTLTPPPSIDVDTLMSREAGDELAAAVDRIAAQVATLGVTPPATPAEVPYRSAGEYARALAAGDDVARELFLAYEGGTIADLGDAVRDSWLGDLTKWVDQARTVFDLVDSGPLPTEGMGVEFAYLDENTVTVAEQVAEADELAFGKLTFSTDRAPLKTYGGWFELSRQEMERAPLSILDSYYRASTIAYAKQTETVVRSALTGATGAHSIAGTDLSDSDGWIDFISETGFWLDDKGLTIDALIVGRDVYKALAKLRDGDANDAPRLLDRSNGTISLPGKTGNLWGIPVVAVNTGTTTNVVRAFNSGALRTFESGGAPLRLSDQDITKLTQAFSVYGYLAVALTDPTAIVKPGA